MNRARLNKVFDVLKPAWDGEFTIYDATPLSFVERVLGILDAEFLLALVPYHPEPFYISETKELFMTALDLSQERADKLAKAWVDMRYDYQCYSNIPNDDALYYSVLRAMTLPDRDERGRWIKTN